MASFACPVLEAYGATEASGGICGTSIWDNSSGNVGGPLPCLKLKLRDLPELGYLSTDNPPRGEVLIKGPPLFKGYFRNKELTKSVLDKDGWLRLGDVGKIHPNGSIELIDRVNSIRKLQHGFYVAP